MKHINRSNKLVQIISVAIFTLGVTSLAGAKVASVTGSSSIEIDGQEYKTVSVKCRNTSDRPLLMQRSGTRKWCDSAIAEACYSEKIRAAQYVCSSGYKRKLEQLAASSPSKAIAAPKESINVEVAVDNSAMIAEQLKINEAISAIKARRLVLRQRESDLLEQLGGS